MDNVYTSQQIKDIEAEFSRNKEICYLDHAGTTLYSKIQMENIFKDFASNFYANPHAFSTSSQFTLDCIDIARYQILNYFNTNQEEYSVVFTSGATHALKLIAETFKFKTDGTLAYLEDNHTSVLGMRNFAPNFREIKVPEAINILAKKRCNLKGDHDNIKTKDGEDENDYSNCLFVYPAQSNFAGTKYPLSWINSIHNNALNLNNKPEKWYCVLDAAGFVPTDDLNLTKYKPDFIPISFYKIFGYPTGLGALLVRKTSKHLLEKKYFGGGTVLMALSSKNIMIPRNDLHDSFEDGTVDFLSIAAIRHGFDTLTRLKLSSTLIAQHTFHLGKYVFERLSEMHHANGEIVVELYHDTCFENAETQGGIVNFNLRRLNGNYVGYAEVLHIANLHGIQLRTGCSCNPGACQKFLKLSSEDVKRHFQAGHKCGDQYDLVDGYPTGSVRISFGYMSTYDEAERFLTIIENCFVTAPIIRKKRIFKTIIFPEQNDEIFLDKKINDDSEGKFTNGKNGHQFPSGIENNKIYGKLLNIYLYPVKSCGALSVENDWPLTKTGLKYDRKWMIVNSSGSCVTQKNVKELVLIKPFLDFNKRILRLQFEDSPDISVPFDLNENINKSKTDNCFLSKVCGDRVKGYDCGDAVADWLSQNLQKPGLRLLRQCDFADNTFGRTSKKGEQILSLANKAEYLLVNLASIRWLKPRIPESDVLFDSLDSLIQRFRPNFLVDFQQPLVENNIESVQFGDVLLNFSENCTRCQIICVDQTTGCISKEPLQTLMKEFKGKVTFGVYLSNPMADEEVHVRVNSTAIAIKGNESIK